MTRLRGWLKGFGYGRLIALALLLVFLQLRAWNPPALEYAAFRVFDLYQWLAPRTPASEPVAIVDIDERSLREFGQWPWPRTRIAELIDNVAANGGVAIGFDMVFPEPDRLNPDRIATALPALTPALRATLMGLETNDDIMAAALRRFPSVVGQSGLPQAPPGVDAAPRLERSAFAFLGADPRPFLYPRPAFPALLQNVPKLEAAASGRGLFNIAPEFGGVIRRVPLLQNVGDVVRPALSLELLRVSRGETTSVVRAGAIGIEGLIVADTRVPTDARGRYWLRYAPHDKARYVSAFDVLNNTDAAKTLDGKLVLVGTSAIGLFDLKATPVHPAMPGVEIHAQVIETIIDGSFLHRPANAVGGEVALALFVGLSIIVLVPILGAMRVLLLGFAVAVTLVALSWYLFMAQGTLVDVAYPLLSSFLVFLALTFVNYRNEETQRHQIRSAFSQYLSPDMVNQLSADPSRLRLGGETRQLTLLFSDVRGFTRISETYMEDPEGLTRLMNRLLTPLTNAIMATRGTIDKYIGDAIVAFWNAPLDDADHARHACRSALHMLREVDDLNAARRAEAGAAADSVIPMELGIGVNTGPCVVGNMGSDLRFDYSVLGDSVNVASRLENLTKSYGVRILVGPDTARLVGNEFAILEIDTVRVQGKETPTTIFALLGDGDVRAAPDFQSAAADWQQLLTMYRGQDWAAALVALDRIAARSSNWGLEGVVDLYRERIDSFRTSPPLPTWDGVFDTRKAS